MKSLLVASLALVLSAFAAYADVPSPDLSTTTLDATGRLYMCPDGLGDCPSASFTVTVRNASGNPINNAVVEVLIGGQGVQTVICAGQTLTANTNASGVVNFNVGGGGCLKQTDAVVIRANGVTIRSFSEVMSSDYAGTDDVGIANRWDKRVNAVDLSAFVAAYVGGSGPSSCHDYNNTGVTDPVDLSTFVAAYKSGTNFCN